MALITGGSAGIGLATALALGRLGWRLVLVGRDADRLEKARAALGREEGVLLHKGDVGVSGEPARMVREAVQAFGRLDALVNNAGLAPLKPIDETTPSDIDRTFAINALAPAKLIHHAWPVFTKQRRGCVVNISTMGTKDPFPGFFAYAAAKASVNLMARSCANEGAEIGVRAFAIAPAAVETAMLRELFAKEQIPESACLSPEEVAAVVVQCITGKRDAENGSTIFLSR